MTTKKKKTDTVSVVCPACNGHPEGACSRCDGEGMDPEMTDCTCDCCGGTGACDGCGGLGKVDRKSL